MGGEAIQVAVRIRPFLPFEAGSKSCIDVLPGEDDQNSSTSTTKISQGKSVHIGYHRHHNRDNSSSNNNGRQSLDNGHTFTFDKCFSGLANQVTIYKSLIVPLLENCLEGYNATALAYGQTGAGELVFVCMFWVVGWLLCLILLWGFCLSISLCLVSPPNLYCIDLLPFAILQNR